MCNPSYTAFLFSVIKVFISNHYTILEYFKLKIAATVIKICHKPRIDYKKTRVNIMLYITIIATDGRNFL